MCQLTGQATVLSYAPMIFHQVGFQSDAAAVLATLGLGVVKVTAAVTITHNTSCYVLLFTKAQTPFVRLAVD